MIWYKLEGKGVKSWGDESKHKGDRYVGSWKDNKKNSEATLTWANGDRYQGSLKDDKKHCQG